MCSLTKGETAMFSCPAASLRGPAGGNFQVPADLDYVELQATLLHMTEVRTVLSSAHERQLGCGAGWDSKPCLVQQARHGSACAVELVATSSHVRRLPRACRHSHELVPPGHTQSHL